MACTQISTAEDLDHFLFECPVSDDLKINMQIQDFNIAFIHIMGLFMRRMHGEFPYSKRTADYMNNYPILKSFEESEIKNRQFSELLRVRPVRIVMRKLKMASFNHPDTLIPQLISMYEADEKYFNAMFFFTAASKNVMVEKRLIEFMQQQPPLQTELIVYRAVRIENYKRGDSYQLPRHKLVSTTLDVNVARAIARRSTFKIFEIRIPQGERVIVCGCFSAYPTQDEIIINGEREYEYVTRHQRVFDLPTPESHRLALHNFVNYGEPFQSDKRRREVEKIERDYIEKYRKSRGR